MAKVAPPRRVRGHGAHGRCGRGRMLPAWTWSPTSTANPTTNAHRLWNTTPATAPPTATHAVYVAFSLLRAPMRRLRNDPMFDSRGGYFFLAPRAGTAGRALPRS